MGFSSPQILSLLLILILAVSAADADSCKASGKLRGKKPPKGKCNQKNGSECCKPGKLYDTYKCSPRSSGHTKAILTLNSFEEGGDGGGKSECDNKYHSDNTRVVALSTGWLKNDHVKRCNKVITIFANGHQTTAKVVDECDSTEGCDDEHDYQPPCQNNIVDASPAVWEALKVKKDDRGYMQITWTDGGHL